MRLRLTISGGSGYVKNVRRGKALGQQEEVAYEGVLARTKGFRATGRKRVKARKTSG